MYNRDGKKVDSALRIRFWAFWFICPPLSEAVLAKVTLSSGFNGWFFIIIFLPLYYSLQYSSRLFVSLHSQAALRFHFTTLIHPQESEEATPEMSFWVSMSVSGGGPVLARIITAWGSRSPMPRWWFVFFGAGQSVRMVRSLGIVGGLEGSVPAVRCSCE